MKPANCICGGIDMGNDNWDIDVNPDCPIHGGPICQALHCPVDASGRCDYPECMG